jgi:hypothetical protein
MAHTKKFAETKQPKLKGEVPIWRLKVVDETYVEQTREGDGQLYGDRGETYTSHRLQGLRLDDYGDVIARLPVKSGDSLWLVYAIYSTGNSFGWDSCDRIEYYSVHRTREAAVANKERLAAQSPHGTKRYPSATAKKMRMIVHDDGSKEDVFLPWDEMFASLDRIDIEELVVE